MATSKTRIHAEPAFVVHRYDWSESSLILETFTRHHGRVALVAKGAKRPSSNFRPVLLPLQPLVISYSGDAEIRTLKVAEWLGGHIMPMGEALLMTAAGIAVALPAVVAYNRFSRMRKDLAQDLWTLAEDLRAIIISESRSRQEAASAQAISP